MVYGMLRVEWLLLSVVSFWLKETLSLIYGNGIWLCQEEEVWYWPDQPVVCWQVGQNMNIKGMFLRCLGGMDKVKDNVSITTIFTLSFRAYHGFYLQTYFQLVHMTVWYIVLLMSVGTFYCLNGWLNGLDQSCSSWWWTLLRNPALWVLTVASSKLL